MQQPRIVPRYLCPVRIRQSRHGGRCAHAPEAASYRTCLSAPEPRAGARRASGQDLPEDLRRPGRRSERIGVKAIRRPGAADRACKSMADRFLGFFAG